MIEETFVVMQNGWDMIQFGVAVNDMIQLGVAVVYDFGIEWCCVG